MDDLVSKKCIPCSLDIPPMKREKAEQLMEELVDWELIDEDNILRIKKEFKFKDFKEALEFVNKVGELAELEGHHPNLLLHSWNRVKVEIYTHKIRGLHQNDFILAAKIEAIS